MFRITTLILFFMFFGYPLVAQPYLDASLSVEERVEDLLSRMNVQEKVGQLNQLNGVVEFTGPPPTSGGQKEQYDLLRTGQVGSMLNVLGVDATREAQRIVMENTRLKIPLMFAYDVIHGYKTMFPLPLAEAASWDLDTIEQSARVAAIEASASGLHWTFAPMMDVGRDPRWGRVMEGAGEDPYLVSQVSLARIKGFQGDTLSSATSIAATAKHFAGYAFAEAGRDYATADVSDQTLHNVILPPFKAAALNGVATMMNGFHDIGGVPVTASSYLQRDLLKGAWDFEGLVVSDWASIEELRTHGYAEDMKDAARISLKAGNDIDMESRAYQEHLVGLVEAGEIDENILDDAVRRVLRLKFKLGLFEDPYGYSNPNREEAFVYNDEHRAISRDVAKRSIVLLKNRANLLPIDFNKTQKIAVIGQLAADKDSPLGNWRGQAIPNSAVSLLEGVEAIAGENTTIEYAPAYKMAKGIRAFYKNLEYEEDNGELIPEAVELAASADLVILAFGEDAYQSGEGRSQLDIGLRGQQMQAFSSVLEANPNVVVVLMAGRPIVEPDLYANAPALLNAWHLGTEAGHAIADVLSGAYNPSAKLPMTIPAHQGQIPVYYSQKNTGRPVPKDGNFDAVFWSHYNDGGNAPQYPFGFGLSYTTFEYATPSLSSTTLRDEEEITLSVEIKNTGNLKGEEVVQLYLRDYVASRVRPLKELISFQKVEIEAGQSKRVDFMIHKDMLGFYNQQNQFVTEPGRFALMIGPNAENLQLLDIEYSNQ